MLSPQTLNCPLYETVCSTLISLGASRQELDIGLGYLLSGLAFPHSGKHSSEHLGALAECQSADEVATVLKSISPGRPERFWAVSRYAELSGILPARRKSS